MCRLFETIRIVDGIPQNLRWHEERMIRSGFVLDTGWGIHDEKGTMNNVRCKMYDVRCTMYDSRNPLADLIKVPENLRQGIVRCKVVYERDIIDITYQPYVRQQVRSLKLVHAGRIDYHLKYHDRSVLEKLFAQRGECDDVIIVNDGLITDTSFSNLVFFDGEFWHTPAHPLLEGTCRARLLSEKRIITRDIRPSDLERYQGCRLINAMRDLDGEEDISNVEF